MTRSRAADHRGWARVAAALLVCLAAGLAPARGQTTSASLTGVVRDESGRPARGAVVEARSESSGVVRTAVTDGKGRYGIDLLAPGEWIVVARAGERSLSDSHTVTLRLQQTLTLDLTLGAGLTERVSVQAAAPRLDPHRSGGELRILAAQSDGLPIAGRVATDLALLDASVRPTPPGNFYGERGAVFVLNGQSGRSNSFLVDGLDNNDQSSNTTLNAFFSQQAISEFVVLTHQYAPEFGRASGGILNIITERGSNDSAASFFAQGTRGSWNDAGRFVDSLPATDGAQEASGRFQTGFKIGGPLREDRAFYFASYEHQTLEDVVPFTGIGRDGAAGGRFAAPGRDDNLFLRTDFNLSSSDFLMVRLSADDRVTRGLNVGGITTPEAGFLVEEDDQQLAATWTKVLSADRINELRLLAGRSSFDQFANSDRPGVERPSGLFGGNNLNRQLRDEDRLQIVENFTWRRGPHTFKIGADVTRSRTRIDVRFNPSGNFIYQTDARFEPGDCGDIVASQVRGSCSGDPAFPCRSDVDCRGMGVCRYEPVDCPGEEGVDDDGDGLVDEPGLLGTYPLVYQLIVGNPKARLDDTRIALFAQDSWQATPSLQLDYGLRWDISTFTLPDSARVDSKIPNGGAGRDGDNVAPRFGFAWAPGSEGRLVVRGGTGIFYDKLVLGFPAVAAITSGTRIGLFFPQGLTIELTEDVVEELGVDFIRQVLFFPENLILRFSTGTRLDTPYAVQSNLGVEAAAGEGGLWRANLVRAQGYHLPLMRDLNPVVATDTQGLPVHRDPDRGSIAAIVTQGRSWYTGLELGWSWRGEGAWHSVSYTLSRSEDMGPDPLKGGIYLPPDSDDLSGERGRSDHDRRHRVVVAGETPLPWLGLRASAVLQFATGAPFNVTTGRDENIDGITTDRPEGVRRNTGEDTPLGPVNRLRREESLDPVRSLSEPTFAQVDLRVSRPFSFGATRWKGDLFLQVFNLFDRFNGGPVEGRAISRNFGRPIGQVGPPRTYELGLRVGF